MKPVFQTLFGYPTGNCFNAAVASVLELDEIPAIDPQLEDEAWIAAWCKFFTAHDLKWWSTTSEPETDNWDAAPQGIAIAHVEVVPGVLHAVVCEDGVPIHDVMPGSPFIMMGRTAQRAHRCVSWSSFAPLLDGQRNGFTDDAPADFTPAPVPV